MDVFDLVARIRLDDSEYEQGVGKAQSTFSSLASGVGKGLATVAKVGAAAVTAGVAGVTALTKMGVEGYAQYEQLVGGVQTLFGVGGKSLKEYAAEHGKTADEMFEEWAKLTTGERIALNNAENAYKTAGLSANAYMETVTSFSASLIQSLGGDTAKAANVADMAITDMSDNANKMGTSMEMIQNAYNGFAKGNYTMLDNLKLGYGGTQEEMKRLLKDAEAISGIKYDISSFADVTEAIHVMQEEMGIAGTTAREAASTIEGSISMMKGAWQNLVVGMADENADMETLIDNFVESAGIAAQNLLPRIEQTLVGIGDLIAELAPIIAEALPQLVTAVLPSLLQAGVSLVTSLVDGVITALPSLLTALLDGVEIILVEVFGVSEEKAGEFANGVNSFFTSIGDGFGTLVESAQTEGTWLNEVWTGLQDAAKSLCDFLVALWDLLSAAFTWCVDQINTEGTYLNVIWENIKTKISIAVDIIKGIITTFAKILQGDWSGAWESVKETAQNVWDGICEIFGRVAEWFDKNLVQPINEYVVQPVVGFFEGLRESLVSIWDGICGFFAGIPAWFDENTVQPINEGVVKPIVGFFEGLWESLVSAWDGICEFFSGIPAWFDEKVVQPINEKVIQPIVEFFVGLWESVVAVWDWICNAIDFAILFIVSIIDAAFQLITLPFRFIWENCKEYVFDAFEWIKEKIALASEWVSEKVSEVWGWIRDNIVNPVKEAYEKAVEIFNNIKQAISDKITEIKTKVTEDFNSIKQAISEKITEAKEKATEIFNNIKQIISEKTAEAKAKAAENFDNIKKAISEKITNIKNDVSEVFGIIKQVISDKITEAKTKATEIFGNIKKAISEKITEIKNNVTEIFNAIKERIQKPIEDAKNVVSDAIAVIKSAFSLGLNYVKNAVHDKLTAIKDKFSSIFEGAKNIVKKAIDTIKGYFNFNWELPKLKMPHFSIKGEFSLNPPSVPKLDISWYRKAYDNAMILSNPTIFGYSGASGKYLGGGDGNGNEVVAGESYLMGMIGQVVASITAEQNERIVSLLSSLVDVTAGGNEEMVRALMSDRTFAVGEREFARLVRSYA